MKNIIFITILLLLTSATLLFASSFSEIPSNHWALEAVDELMSKGIVSGYADGTYKGNMHISRYHLALVTAKALASVEQKRNVVTKSDIRIIERLSLEFADELEKMGIKVKSLSADLQGVKSEVSFFKTEVQKIKKIITNGSKKVRVSGDVLTRNYGYVQKKGNHRHRTETLFRIQLDSIIDDNTSVHTRWNLLEHSNNDALARNQWNGNNKRTGTVEVANLEFKNTFKTNTNVKVGRDWCTHGHGLVIHDYMDSISINKEKNNFNFSFNCFFDRNNSINNADYLNVYNINADYNYDIYKLYFGLYYNSRDWGIDNTNTRVALNNNKKDIKFETGISGKITCKNEDLSYDLAGVFNKSESYRKFINRAVDYKGWLGHLALKYDCENDFNFKLAYTCAENDSYASIKRNDSNSYVLREETPFEDLSTLITNGVITNISNFKIQLKRCLDNEKKQSLRVAFDIIKERDSNTFRTDTNLITAEYNYQLSENSRARFVFQNAKDKDGYYTLPGESEQLYSTEFLARF